jgi:hypothetical protein
LSNLTNLNQKELEQVKNLLLSEFSFFCQLFIDPEYWDEQYIVPFCNFLQYSKPNKLVVLPRTHLKTTIAAELYPLWKATKKPSLRCLISSNTTPNAQKTLRSIRDIVENNTTYHLFFPETIPDFNKTRWSDSCCCLKRPTDYPEGTFEAAGVGANIIRRHFNIIIEDDTVAPKKDELTEEEAMPSKEDVEKAVGFHKLTIPLLINEEDERIVIGTRWAGYDLIDFIKRTKNFDEFDKKAYVDEANSVPLYPKRYSPRRLENIRTDMGQFMFSALYLNQPLAKEFMAFNPDWTKYYIENELPSDGYGLVTVDPADPPTGSASQDYCGIVSCKHTKKGIFVRRYRRQRLSDKQIIASAMELAKLDNATKIRIEANRYAHLEAGFREEMAKINEFYSIDAVKAPRIDKAQRIKNRLSPLFENGVIFLKKGMHELEDELYQFPYGRHDDLIDSLSWQIERYTATEYEHQSPKPLAPNYRSFSFDQIRESINRRFRSPYPFQKQNEYVRSS